MTTERVESINRKDEYILLFYTKAIIIYKGLSLKKPFKVNAISKAFYGN